MGEHEVVIQTRLGPEKRKDYYIFPKEAVIWPQGSRRGALTADLQAKKLVGEKINRLQAWVAEDEIHLFLDGRDWQRSSGTHFGAYVKTEGIRKVEVR